MAETVTVIADTDFPGEADSGVSGPEYSQHRSRSALVKSAYVKKPRPAVSCTQACTLGTEGVPRHRLRANRSAVRNGRSERIELQSLWHA